MKEQIHKELAALQQELSALAERAKQIESAKEVAVSSAKSGQELQQKYEEQLIEIKNMTGQFQLLSQRSLGLVERIDKINFPERLDKIDASIVAITTGLQFVQQKLENTNRDVKDEFKEARRETSNQGETTIGHIKTIKIIIIIIAVISIINILIMILK